MRTWGANPSGPSQKVETNAELEIGIHTTKEWEETILTVRVYARSIRITHLAKRIDKTALTSATHSAPWIQVCTANPLSIQRPRTLPFF